jgi:D-glycero-D-manno-heptose 1,7-bisphosphate phosphatase
MPEPVTTVFLDRDGTINRKAPEGDYVKSPEELELLPGAAEAIAALGAAGLLLVVITNQRGIALGRMTEEDLERVHARLREELATAGARVDAIYHCPHGEDGCDCRKPRTGMFEDARRDNPRIDFARAVVIGDSWRDVEAGRAIGARTIGLGGVEGADDAAADLGAAADLVLRDATR